MITLESAEPYRFTGAYSGCYALPEVATDKRHVFILHEILRAWSFQSALEIGSFNGATATAFIEAINRGESLTKAMFCDVSVSQSLIDVVTNCRDLDRVRITPEPSWRVLDSKEAFDFILVDASHDIDSVSLELKRLLIRKPLVVMAHDTSATDNGYSACAGAKLLKDTFLRHPDYRCLEDAIRRPGERTERGMFFATTELALFERARGIYQKWK